MKICKSHVLNLLLRAGREKEIMQEIGQSMHFEHNDTEETVQGDNLSMLIEQIVSQLPTQRQRIFRMYRLEGLGLDEIADQLGISKGTVKDHLFKAGSFVRKCLSVQADIPLSLLFVVLSLLI
jgi:RNA polymerase sigma-70 factor (ECF subfamily)